MPKVRLIDHDGQQLGVVPTNEAHVIAHENDMDLVEVAPNSSPPVCKIMDYGKWKYLQSKKEHLAKKKHHVQELKEVRMRPKTDLHDRQIKMTRARKFLQEGNKVQFTMIFRGRERLHRDIAEEIFRSVADQLKDISKIERLGRLQGRRMTMVITPIITRIADKPKPKPTGDTAAKAPDQNHSQDAPAETPVEPQSSADQQQAPAPPESS